MPLDIQVSSEPAQKGNFMAAPSVWIAGVTIGVDVGLLRDWEALYEALFTLPQVTAVEGPLVNGVLVVTFACEEGVDNAGMFRNRVWQVVRQYRLSRRY